jgi:hypothetical protein
MSKTIPLNGTSQFANYSQYVSLGDYSFELLVSYQQNGQWLMHIIADGDVGDIPTTTVDGIDYVAEVMLDGGVDLIEAYQITKTFGQLFFVGEEATLDNLGSANSLVWFAPNEAITYT